MLQKGMHNDTLRFFNIALWNYLCVVILDK